MKVAERISAMLPLGLVIALYAWVTGSPVVATLVGALLLLSLPLAPYIDAPPFAQRAILLVVALFGALGGAASLTAGEAEGPTRPRAILGIFAVTMMLLAAARRFFREPEGGPRVDFGLVTLAVVACGQKRIGTPFIVFAVVFVVAIVAMLRARDRESGWSVVEVNSPRIGVGIGLIVGLFAMLGMLALPRLARITQRQFDRYVLPTDAARVGFTDRLRTFTPDSLVESDALVLRIYGPHVDHLRGRVYDVFGGGAWANSRTLPPVPIRTGVGKASGPSVVEIRGVGAMQKADALARFFVPLGARHLGTTKGTAGVEELGTFRPSPDEPPSPIWFELGEADYAAAKPTAADLRVDVEKEMSAGLRVVLEPIALEWTKGAETTQQKLGAIERHLASDFTYTLAGIAPSKDAAVINFVKNTRRGRCELFATTMALMGRMLGIPTRVVGGFRVAEHNAIGGYDVVREKNAHAWVEAWEGERWQTFDPTPATDANMRREGPALGSLGDALLATWDRALELLGRAALWQFGVVLGGAVALLTVVRLLRTRRERRLATLPLTGADAPLACFAELESALARSGYPRPGTEPLETYSARLREAKLDDVADAVLEYTALRYGGLGDGEAIAARVLARAKEVEGSRLRSDVDAESRTRAARV